MNRFDIVEGHYAYYSLNHGGQGSWMYERLCKIRKYFTPGMSWSESKLEQGAIEVYDALAQRFRTEFYRNADND